VRREDTAQRAGSVDGEEDPQLDGRCGVRDPGGARSSVLSLICWRLLRRSNSYRRPLRNAPFDTAPP